MKTGLAALATLAFMISAPLAMAAENPLARDKAVLNLKGLDLASADGQQRLAVRIDDAARTVCGDRVASIHLALEAQASECRAAVVADVRSQVEARMAKASLGKPALFAAR